MRDGWARSSLGDLLKAGVLAGIQDGNHGNDHPKSSEYVSEGIPFVVVVPM
jgi:type I restriction enzyme S subunit